MRTVDGTLIQSRLTVKGKTEIGEKVLMYASIMYTLMHVPFVTPPRADSHYCEI